MLETTHFKLLVATLWTLKRALSCIQSETTAWNRSPQQRLLASDLINVEGPQFPPKLRVRARVCASA